MDWTMILAAAGGAVALVGAGGISWQIYHMTVIDAKARGFKHPKFWGMFTMSGNNSGGLVMYLIGRRNYHIQNMSAGDREELERRKKAAVAGIVFLAAGLVALILGVMNM